MNQLLIFAKYPEPGRVKTRLAKRVGDHRAALMYKEMVEEVVLRTKPKNKEYRRSLYFDPPKKLKDFKKWIQIDQYHPQNGADLGLRMLHAIQDALILSDQVVLIGTDCVDLDHHLIIQAFDKLNHADIVVGPAKDGGYYLIGCKKSHPELFDGIEWSTKKVFKQTMEKAKNLDLSVGLLKTLADIDE